MKNNFHDIEIAETERIPNKFAAKLLIGILLTLFFACIMNELKIVEVNKLLVWGCFAISFIGCACAFLLVEDKKMSIHPATKYFLMGLTLLLTLLVNIFLNVFVILLLLMPMFLAIKYRSIKISFIAIAGTLICILIYPIISWKLGTWSYNILESYLENTCNISIIETAPTTLLPNEIVFNLLIYVSLPQIIIVAIFGSLTIETTKSNIKGLNNRLKVMQLTDNLSKQLNNVSLMQDRILFSMADLIEGRDAFTGGHVKRTQQIVNLIVNAMYNDPQQEITSSFCSSVVKAAPLHDIGKISIDDAILRKPGLLNDEERLIVNNHSVTGAQILNNVLTGIEDDEFVKIATNIALYHHESYDGSGYPKQLKGKEIPLEARIMSIADVFDALVSKRSYKEALTINQAFEQINELMGTQFDPDLKPYFMSVRHEIEEFYSKNTQKF